MYQESLFGLAGPALRIASVPAVAGLTAKSFEWLEGALSKEGKHAISQWLRSGSNDEGERNWLTPLQHLIDAVFGPKPVSLKFIVRSCIASLLAAAIMFALYLISQGELKDVLTSIFSFGGDSGEDTAFFFLTFGVCLIVNFATDYGSLLVSRKIVQWMAADARPMRLLQLLLLDSVASVAIATVIIFSQSYYLNSFADSMIASKLSVAEWHEPMGAVKTFYQGYSCSINGALSPHHLPFCTDAGTPYGVYFYGSLFTSLWVWLYVFGGISIRVLKQTKRLWKVLAPYLDLDENPLKAIGRVAALVVGVGYTLLLGFLFLADKAF